MKKNLMVIILIVLTVKPIFTQQDSSVTIEDYLDLYAGTIAEDNENSDLIEVIESMIISPIDLNHATESDLLKIPFIDIYTAQNIIEYRNKNGSFFALKEMYMIDGIDKEKIKLIIPLLSIAESNLISPKHGEDFFSQISFRSRIISDLQTRRGFTENIFQGNNLKTYSRLSLSRGEDYKAGILIEKDPGEKSYMDFTSFFLSINSLFNSRIIFGDYLAQFGQGLILWSPYAFSKGSDAVSTIIRRNRSFVPYAGTDENQFFRGAALTSSINDFDLSVFYSFNIIDANIESEINGISSLYLTGLHRTTNDLQKKDKIKNRTYGARVDYFPTSNFNLSLIYYNVDLNLPLIENTSNDLSGKQFGFSSIGYDYIINKLRFSGEIGYNNISVATINNMALIISRELSAIFSIRGYPRNFGNLYANGMAEKTGTQNEFGIYTGIKLRSKLGVFDLYFDQFKFPYPTASLPMPSKGNELMFNFTGRLSNKILLNLRYFTEIKDIPGTTENIKEILNRNIKKYRTEIVFTPNKNLRLKSRYELITYNVDKIKVDETGYIIFQDARVDFSDNFRCYARIILFNTQSYNTRLYSFENDLSGVLSNPALYGEGIKWYLLINYKLTNNFLISLKYSELYKPYDKTLGSGLSEIPGNLYNYVSFQLDYKL